MVLVGLETKNECADYTMRFFVQELPVTLKTCYAISLSILLAGTSAAHLDGRNIRLRVTLRLTVNLSRCRAPSGAHDQILFTV
jgi:hypothetical protein